VDVKVKDEFTYYERESTETRDRLVDNQPTTETAAAWFDINWMLSFELEGAKFSASGQPSFSFETSAWLGLASALICGSHFVKAEIGCLAPHTSSS